MNEIRVIRNLEQLSNSTANGKRRIEGWISPWHRPCSLIDLILSRNHPRTSFTISPEKRLSNGSVFLSHRDGNPREWGFIEWTSLSDVPHISVVVVASESAKGVFVIHYFGTYTRLSLAKVQGMCIGSNAPFTPRSYGHSAGHGYPCNLICHWSWAGRVSYIYSFESSPLTSNVQHR